MLTTTTSISPSGTQNNIFAVRDYLRHYRDSGETMVLVFHPLEDKNVAQAFFNLQQVDYALLFANTPLGHLIKESPYVCVINNELFRLINGILECETVWGFICTTPADFKNSLQHWRDMLLVKNEGGAEYTHLLLYYADVCKRLFTQFTEQECSTTLGPHSSIATFGKIAGEKEPSWMVWENPLLESCSSAEVVTRYRETQKKKTTEWLFKKRYWDAFADKTDGILAYNISEYLFEHYPGETGRKHAEHDIQNFVLECMQQARRLGLTAVNDMELFASCCLLYGSDFYQTKISGDGDKENNVAVTVANLKKLLVTTTVTS